MGKGYSLLTDKMAICKTAIEQNQTIETFLGDRFQIIVPNDSMAIITGSSSAWIGEGNLREVMVCDSASLATQWNNVIPALHLAVSDGLGYEEHEPTFNESVRAVADYSVYEYVQNMSAYYRHHNTLPDLNNILPNIADLSKSKALPIPGLRSGELYGSTCSLSAASVYHDGLRWKLQTTQIGDGMIVIISGKDLKVKGVMPACVKNRGFGNFSPCSLQEAKAPDYRLDEIDIEEEDFILSMTDGVYANLPIHSDKITVDDQVTHIKTIVDSERMNEMIMAQKFQKHVTAYGMASCIMAMAMEGYMNSFQELRALLGSLENFVVNKAERYNQKFISELLSDLKQEDEAIFTKLNQFLSGRENTDGVSFNIEKCEIYFMIDYLKKQEQGDCSTLGIIKVPFYRDELIRALIEQEDLSTTVKRNIRQKVTLEQLEESLARLDSEMTCAERQTKWGQAHPIKRYTADQISQARVKFHSLTPEVNEQVNSWLTGYKSKRNKEESKTTSGRSKKLSMMQ